MIVTKNITKLYGKNDTVFTALEDISCTIPSKSTVAIIGKSGSGKSTLMHIMSGLDRPTSGSILIDSQDISELSAKDIDNFRSTKMSFIFQSFFVEGNQTCYQNVMLPLEIARTPISRRKKLVLDALKAVGLEEKAQTLAANLSGGQKQRLAIARAIVHKPRILFADEPTGNLDSVTGDKVMQLLFGLNERIGCTLILVTHDTDLAKRCAMQIRLKDGRVESIGRVKKRITV